MSSSNENFSLLVDAVCERQPARPAIFQHQGESFVSYGELAALIDGWAAALGASGAGPGDSVAIWLPNSPAFVAAFLATLRLGAVAAPLGILLKPREIHARLALAKPTVLVTTGVLARELGPVVARVLAVDPTVVEAGPRGGPSPVARAGDDLAVLIFTSGTSGEAKAAELTHRGVRWNAGALAAGFAMGPGDVQLAVAPFSHVLGMTGVMNACLVSGSAVALMDRFDAAAALRLMGRTGTTGVMGAPPMFGALVREARKGGDAPRLRFAMSGGAALTAELARDVRETFGCALLDGYGMSEVGGGITLTPGPTAAKQGSVGPALPGSELRIVDLSTRAPLALGARGEVAVRSPSVMKGYRHDPAGTRAVLDDGGWLLTGDIGYLDGDGYLFLVDRKKELIIRSGYNVYPREVEEVLSSCPGVLEAAVLGVPDDEHGEEVVALVVGAQAGALDPEAVKAFARERLAAYKYPRHVVVVTELPKGPTGKISKRDIDRQALRALSARAAGDIKAPDIR
jgi:long-chain acyl-CoA synthetase